MITRCSRSPRFAFLVLSLIVTTSLLVLLAMLWRHPAWYHGSRFQQLDRAIARRFHPAPVAEPPAFVRGVPFKLGDVEHTKRLPWLPGFRNATAGIEEIRLPDGSRLNVSWRVLSGSRPRAIIINGTLTEAEAIAIRKMAARDLARSEVIVGKNGENARQDARSSHGMFMLSAEQVNLPANVKVRHITRAIAGIDDETWMESTQVLRYRPGERYVPHPDYYDADDTANLNRGGQRIATAITWLNVVDDGGATTFPVAGISVNPEPFNTLLFYDCDEIMDVDRFSIHSGEPPGVGSEKWVAVQWLHGKPFF